MEPQQHQTLTPPAVIQSHLSPQISSLPSYKHQTVFVIDIDGTLIISHREIPGSSQALNYLQQNDIPYLLLTNNISHSEERLAGQINKLLNLNVPISKDQVILNYTPTKGIVDWENINVLLIGRQSRFKQILPLKHIPKYVTVEEYCTLFPQIVSLNRREINQNTQLTRKIVKSRLGLSDLTKKSQIKFGVICIICCPASWQQSLQVIMDILNSQDGRFPQNKSHYSYQPEHIPILTTVNDFIYTVSDCNLPRILIRPFNDMVKSTFKQLFGQQLNMKIYGKPNKEVYQYTQKHCEEMFRGKTNKYVMIGDTPDTDIKGAYENGWDSILLKSGLAMEDSKLANVSCTNLLDGILAYLRTSKHAQSNRTD